MKENDDYYKILGIDKNADENQIKKAYRKLAIKYHPDKNQGNKAAEDKFKTINEAYNILSDKEKRSEYNQFGKGYGNMSHGRTDHIFRHFFNDQTPFDTRCNSGGPNVRFNSNIFFTRSYNRPYNDLINGLIKNGTNIIVHGLNQEKYNNKSGYIKGYDPRKARYLVELDNNKILLKIDNIQQIVKGRIYNLQNSRFNNKMGEIVGYINDKYKVIINNIPVGVNKNNFIIDNGTCIQVVDLQNNIALNKKRGIIINFDINCNKYIVEINREKYKMKQINIKI